MNEGTEGPTLLTRARRAVAGSGRAFGFLLLAAGGVVVWEKLSSPYGVFDPPRERILLAVGLIGGGILLLRDDPTLRGLVTDRAPARRTPRTRSPLGLVTLAATFLVLGGAIVLGNLSIATLSIGQLAALALIVIGLGLVVGAWWGRARWLALVGVLLIPVVMATSYIDMPPRGSVGSFYVSPISLGELESDYDLLLGTMTIDLMNVERARGTTTIDVDVAAGNLTVYVPERLGLHVEGHVERGNVTVGRGYEDGEDLSFERSFEGRPGAARIALDIDGGITSLYVERISRRERMAPHGDRPAKQRPGRDRETSRIGDEGRGRHGRNDGGRSGEGPRGDRRSRGGNRG